jgi:hypothetical protein
MSQERLAHFDPEHPAVAGLNVAAISAMAQSALEQM